MPAAPAFIGCTHRHQLNVAAREAAEGRELWPTDSVGVEGESADLKGAPVTLVAMQHVVIIGFTLLTSEIIGAILGVELEGKLIKVLKKGGTVWIV
jgi:hypothetical protein